MAWTLTLRLLARTFARRYSVVVHVFPCECMELTGAGSASYEFTGKRSAEKTDGSHRDLHHLSTLTFPVLHNSSGLPCKNTEAVAPFKVIYEEWLAIDLPSSPQWFRMSIVMSEKITDDVSTKEESDITRSL